MKRLSCLRFSPLSRVDGEWEARLVVAWPVVAVPIRFWSETPGQLDLLEEAVLGLARAGVTEAVEIRRLLGIPDPMAMMVKRTQDSLQLKNYFTSSYTLTPEGLEALSEGELIYQTEYRSGWVLADRIRGGLFPFVHPDSLSFFARRQIELLGPFVLSPKAAAPTRESLQRQAPVAVAAFNRRRRILADLDEEQQVELERELDEPETLRLERREVEDLELLPEAYYEEHHLLVEVIAELLPGAAKVSYRSISPFSPWEQNLYLETLKRLDNAPLAAKLDALRDGLQDRSRVVTPRPQLPGDEDGWSAVRPLIQEQAPGLRLPDKLVDKLYECEYYYQLSQQAHEEAVPLRRETAVNMWGVLLEASLKEIVEQIAQWPIPPAWKTRKLSRGQALDWYREQLALLDKPNPWFDLPDKLESNLGGIVVTVAASKMSTVGFFGQVRGSSSRDELAKLMLASLCPGGETPPALAALVRSIDEGRFPFAELDRVVDRRNDAGHGGKEINEARPETFVEWLEEMRAAMYAFLRCVFAANGSEGERS